MSRILITGGAGSLGRALISELPPSSYIRVLDCNEHALSLIKNPNVRKLFGDVSDKERVQKAMKGIDTVIHCAAMKNIEITEYNASELIKVNIIGTDNVVSSAVDSGVNKVMFISSDKSVEQTTIYGASKLVGEHVALNYNKTNKTTKISVFRSGNFTESSGNAFEIWKKQIERGEKITITDFNCMRYLIETTMVARSIISAIDIMNGGEIFIPSEEIMPEYPMSVLLKMAGVKPKDDNYIVTGLREGEKLREQLMTVLESMKKEYNEATKCWVIK